MKAFTIAAAAALAMAGTAASATTFSVPLTYSKGVYTGHFGDTVSGSFSDVFDFLLPTTGGKDSFSFTSTSVDADTTITGLKGYLDKSSNAFKFSSVTDPDDGSSVISGKYSGTKIASGLHDLTFSGSVADATSFSGTIVIRAATAVPEPATWAMMIIGVGAIGGMMRRAYRKSEDKFTAKVRGVAAA